MDTCRRKVAAVAEAPDAVPCAVPSILYPEKYALPPMTKQTKGKCKIIIIIITITEKIKYMHVFAIDDSRISIEISKTIYLL